MLVPSNATAFFIPCLSKLRTSPLPSTKITASLESTLGPAGNLPLNLTISSVCRTCRTVSVIVEPALLESLIKSINNVRARSIITSRLELRLSSKVVTFTVALQGPTRSTVSSAAAKTDVSTWSILEEITISPVDLPLSLLISTSTRPIRPLF